MEELLQQYFSENTLMQLATINNGQPWLCNVYFVTDEENNIYWTSTKARRHSKEILKDPNSACTIVYDSKRKQALQMNLIVNIFLIPFYLFSLDINIKTLHQETYLQ